MGRGPGYNQLPAGGHHPDGSGGIGRGPDSAGDMGIGNTTPSAALTAALGVPTCKIPGRSPDELRRNTAAGQKALDINFPNTSRRP